jgi:hypothetical protein
MTQFDINTEYEQIFGISNYPTLYESEDEEYKTTASTDYRDSHAIIFILKPTI